VAQTKLTKLGAVATAILAAFFIAWPRTSSAQGFSGLSQLFGGGSMHSRNSSKSNNAVTVERNSAPYVGSFDGKQKQGSGADLNAEFACYPAHDSALPDTNAFVCYRAQTPSNTGDPKPDD